MASTNNRPSYILRYFDMIGNGESSRLMLTAANVEWTEEHPEWPQEKANQPFGRLPVLIEKSADGSPDFVICESGNIERYLGRTLGFIPSDLRKAALQEQVRDQTFDVITSFAGYVRSTSEEDKKARLEAFWEILDKYIAVYSKHIQDNGNTGYLFGDSLSFADITTYMLFKNVLIGFAKFKEDIAVHAKPKLTPEIVKLISTVEAEPSISKIVFKSGDLSAAVRA